MLLFLRFKDQKTHQRVALMQQAIVFGSQKAISSLRTKKVTVPSVDAFPKELNDIKRRFVHIAASFKTPSPIFPANKKLNRLHKALLLDYATPFTLFIGGKKTGTDFLP